MRKLTILVSAAAFVAAASSSAMAEEITGEIKSTDTATRTVTLADGSSYLLPADVDGEILEPGMNVWIEFVTDAHGQLAASALAAAGSIESIDVAARTLTLEDGTSFVLPESVDPATLQVGMNVQVQFSAGADGELRASSVEPAA